MNKNEFIAKREEYKKNVIDFIVENIAKCKGYIFVIYNDEGYNIKLNKNNIVCIYDDYDDYLYKLSDERPLDFLDKVAREISYKIQ